MQYKTNIMKKSATMSDKFLGNYVGFNYRADDKLLIFGIDYRMVFKVDNLGN